MRHTARTALTALAFTCALAAAAPGAAAMPAGNAPSCVAVWHNTGTITKTGYARNDCGHRLRLKIVWAHGSDGACHTVDPGQTISSKIPRGPRTFDGANSC
ncbi:hypothetical protein [Nonomuraea candida]|uniref:hypothetical protein n=1 Tax=Nonomuraea candida TaxID=359159 RepID=UPI0005BCA770|nr:hypothetical protein [Nonomuraea candida]